MKGKHNHRFPLLAITAGLLAATGVDIPQALAASGAAVIEEVIVTARRREESLQEVPIAVTVLSGDELTDRGVTEVIELKQVVPGLNISRTANGPATLIYGMRGQQARDTVITQDAPVALYVDEVIMTPVAGTGLGLFDLESVQVLKGPQGTLFGRNTTGGAVLYSTKKPEDEFGGKLRVGYGKYDERKVEAALNVPVSDAVRLRGAVYYIKSDGFGDITAGPQEGDGVLSQDEKNVRFTAAIDPTDWMTTLTTFYYSDADYGPSPFTIREPARIGGSSWFVFESGLIPGGAPAGTLSEAIARNAADYDIESLNEVGHQIENWGVYNTITVELSDNLLFKNIIGYRDTENFSNNDMDGTILPLLDIKNNTTTDSWSWELQLQGTAFDERLEFITGLYYYELDGEDGGEGTVFFGGAPNVQGGFIKNESFSGFTQISYDLTDALTVNAGFRYTVDTRDATIVSGDGNGLDDLTSCNFTDENGDPQSPDACGASNNKSFSEPSWLIGLDYKLSDDTLLYIASRHSYRSGGFNLRGNANVFVEDDFYDQEVVTDVEFGVKTGFELGDSWSGTTNVAVYHQWYEDIQKNITAVREGQIGNVTRNAAKAKVWGGELEVVLQYLDLVNLTLGYAYENDKYDDYPTVATVFGVPLQPDDYSDRDFAFPDHQFNASVTVTPDVGDLGELSLTATVFYQSSYPHSEEVQNLEQLQRRLAPADWAGLPDPIFYDQDSFTIVNARIALNNISGSGFSAALWGDNLTDERYYDNAFIFMDNFGNNFSTLSPPFTFGVEVSYEF